MKLLVDTSVWSLSLRRRSAGALSQQEQRLVSVLANAIVEGRVGMIGPIRQELLSGIKEHSQYETLKSFLRDFPDESLESGDYEEAANLFNLWRSRGVECGPVDMLVCAVAARRGWGILSNDKALNRCMAVFAREKKSAGRN